MLERGELAQRLSCFAGSGAGPLGRGAESSRLNGFAWFRGESVRDHALPSRAVRSVQSSAARKSCSSSALTIATASSPEGSPAVSASPASTEAQKSRLSVSTA